jgi:hypothetical protein
VAPRAERWPEIMSIPTVAKYIDRTEDAVYTLVKKGQLPVLRWLDSKPQILKSRSRPADEGKTRRLIFVHRIFLGRLPKAREMEQSLATQQHYRVKDIAAMWSLSDRAIIRLFRDEPGVLSISNFGSGKRTYRTLSIPSSAVARVHQRLSNKTLQTSGSSGNPPRVIRLRDLNARVPKQSRNIVKRKVSQQLSNRERVA